MSKNEPSTETKALLKVMAELIDAHNRTTEALLREQSRGKSKTFWALWFLIIAGVVNVVVSIFTYYYLIHDSHENIVEKVMVAISDYEFIITE